MTPVDTLDLLLHPVRLRIVHALAGGRIRTTAALCVRLPDVSKATVYRQVALLVDGGLLEIVQERRVRGAVERHYRLIRARPAIDPARVAAMSLEDHRASFLAAVAALVAEFDAYLDRGSADPAGDSVGYRQLPVWLDRAEVAELVREESRIITSLMGNQPGPDRRLYLLSPILFPIDEPEDGQDQG
jgi:DNA-binding transcriptional ArsR family regulator